ncbi:uncharacterized protein LOC135172977 [Diachasmimorpha longicaudata]|uniref:uncharacterized protein LOC135172977 n=1 Tax=Diachasmimorpha longicaudata TaxID=58733 RepID=UPI0030B8C8E7
MLRRENSCAKCGNSSKKRNVFYPNVWTTLKAELILRERLTQPNPILYILSVSEVKQKDKENEDGNIPTLPDGNITAGGQKIQSGNSVPEVPDTPALDAIGLKPPSVHPTPPLGKVGSPDLVILDDSEAITLDPDILEILGADPSKPPDTEISLHGDLESRWSFWLSSNLQKDELTKLMERYPRKSTKCLFEAPTLNPEIASISTEALVQRDKRFCASQNLSGSALVALGVAISSLLSEDDVDKLALIQNLYDAGKMMTQVHHGFSLTRPAFISSSLNKQVRSTLEATTPVKHLYGSNLSEKVKEVKTMAKLGQDLKVTAPPPKKQRSLNSKSPFVSWKKQTGQRPRIPARSTSNTSRRPSSKRSVNPQSTSTSAKSSNTQEKKW